MYRESEICLGVGQHRPKLPNGLVCHEGPWVKLKAVKHGVMWMAKTIEWNPHRGTYYEIEDDNQTGGVIIHTKQDVSPVLDRNKKLRNSGVNDLGGLKDHGDLKHYASIPAHVELALREKGIDIYNQHHTQDMIREIERNYPECKVTNRKML